MKKTLLFALLLSTLSAAVAQNDTIYGISPRYYCTKWYDTLPESWGSYGGWYAQDIMSLAYSNPGITEEQFITTMQRYRINEPMAIKGIAVYSTHDLTGWLNNLDRSADTAWLPEYVKLWQANERDPDSAVCLQSIQWNNLTPKVVRLKETCVINDCHTILDTFAYAESYEAIWKEPVIVDTTFYLSITANSNDTRETGLRRGFPTTYIISRIQTSEESLRNDVTWGFWCNGSGFYTHVDGRYYGGMFPIVDFFNMRVEANDSLLGSVSGSGRFSDLTTHTITATPAPGNYFIKWSDGIMVNPRPVYITQDTLFTAIFDTVMHEYTVTAEPNDPRHGTVTGHGTYLIGDTATLTATALPGFQFSTWNDGDTSNPRLVYVVCDTAFVAYFSKAQGISEADGAKGLTLSPNPASGRVDCILPYAPLPGTRIIFTDAAGTTLVDTPITSSRQSIDISHLPQGVYFVTVASPIGKSTCKLAVAPAKH